VLILVRHGESTGNADGLLLGRIDAPLTDRGRAQVDRIRSSLDSPLTPSVGEITRVISSPLARARHTADALSLGLPVDLAPRWVEVDYGELDGRSLGSVPEPVWSRWRADPQFRPPGGETLAEVGTRVRDACQELFATEGQGARGGDVVVVSHVSPIKAAVCWALGLDDLGAWRLHLGTASVTLIGWGIGGPVLHGFNQTPGA
jgi:probable phosphoglycerate mutase